MRVVSYYRLQFFLCCLFAVIISQASALRRIVKLDHFCDFFNTTGNNTVDRTYLSNLETLLSDAAFETEINYGFYNNSYGENNDRVNVIGLCRGDVNPNECGRCLSGAGVNLLRLCPDRKEAIVWYDNCMLRYSNRLMFGHMEIDPQLWMWNMDNATDWDQFSKVLRNLMDTLRSRATAGDSRRKYAAARAMGPNSLHIYGLVQCTPDLSGTDCNDCLVDAVSNFAGCCIHRTGGRVIGPSCGIRYEIYPFYDPTAESPRPSTLPSLPPPPPPPSNNNNDASSEGNSNMSRTVIAIGVPVVVVALLTIICVYLRGRMPRKQFEAPDDDNEFKTDESLQFRFDTIRFATSDFSISNKLGQGGFGAVYRGKLSNGQEIAVKRLSTNSGQGDLEFKNEVLLVAKLQHRNLVRLLGFCLEGREMLLIYEFVPNKSLDYFIFDPTQKARLDWEKRYKIISGIARGLLYLHQDSRLRIIHRDLKASNILLDEKMNPKISDFGMAKLFGVDETQGSTNRIVGTYGYMAPEYAMHGQFSDKSDVFSFGVLFLEIVIGQKNRGIRHGENVEDLLSFAWKNWMEGTVADIVDPALTNGSRNEIMRCMHIALLCVQENVADRPTMFDIVHMLKSYSITLPVPLEPAFFGDSRTRSLPDMQRKSAQESVNEASITELDPR